MNIEDINTTCFILALIIRDDGERILLGDGFYEFKDSLQHFQPNTFQNDIVELQGTDGQLLAGQVRRTASQPFDGFIGDATTNRELVEQKRREFIAFFRKKHYYTAVYIFPNGTTIQRERGYIVDAPSAPEMWQKFPEYHIALNFEDPNYYEYEEDESGAEIYAHEADIRILADFSGGLVWDYFGAVSDEKTWIDWKNGITVDGLYTFNNGLAGAPLSLTQLTGNATQETLSGKNKMPMASADMTDSGARQNNFSMSLPAGTYTISFNIDSFTLGTNPSFSLAMSIFGAEQVQLIDVQMVTISSSTSLGRYNKTFTISADGTTDRTDNIRIGATAWSNGARAKISNIQIETGSTATDYQEYCGGVPMPNPSFPSPIETVTGAQTVKILGKNMFNFAEFAQDKIRASGVTRGTATATDNSITLTATSNDCYTRYGFAQGYPPIIEVLPNTNYTLSWQSDNTSGTTKGLIYIFGKNASFGADVITNTPDYNTKLTFNSGNHTEISLRLGVATNGNSLTYSNIQLELGSQKSDFEPYQGQSQEINLGKNLLDINSLATTGITVSNGVATGTARAFNTAFGSGIPLKVPALVSISLKAYTDAETTGTNSGLKIRATYTNGTGADTIVFYNNDTTATYKSATTSNNKELEKIAITFGNLPDNTWHISEFQIEASPLPTTFAPYKTPLELAKIGNYQDYIYNDNGTWKIHKETAKIIYDGSEGWSLAGTGTNHFFFFAQTKLSNFGVSNAEKCNIATLAQIHSASSMDGFQVLSDGQVRIRYAPEQTVADWKTFLGSTNMVLYYALATPTDTEITEPELLAQLNAIASTFDGVNNITITPSAGAQGELSVHYATGSIDVGAGYEWELGTVNPQNIITVEGIDRTLPIWEVQGPATNPTLTNATTNQSITWQGTVPSGQTLTVDMANQTATMEGANVFAGIEGEWIELAVGNNIISYTATGATEPSKLKWNGVVG